MSGNKLDKKIDEKCNLQSRLGSCEVCIVNDAKYCCPKCEVKTCSISCLNIHKKELNCNGLRDKTKFLPLKEMTEKDFVSDYTFLEECTRYLSDRKRDKIKRFTRSNKYFPTSLFKLRQAANYRKIRLRILLPLFTKRKLNTTIFDAETKTIYWKIEWYFPNANGIKFVDDNCCENEKLGNLLEKYFNDKNPDMKLLEYYHSHGTSNIQILLKSEGIKRCKDRYFTLDFDKTLNENLKGKIIVEYPSIYVTYKSDGELFDIIDSDDDIEMETLSYQKELYLKYGNKTNSLHNENEMQQQHHDDIQENMKKLEIEKKRQEKLQKRNERLNEPQNFLFYNENVSDGDSSDSEHSDKMQNGPCSSNIKET